MDVRLRAIVLSGNEAFFERADLKMMVSPSTALACINCGMQYTCLEETRAVEIRLRGHFPEG